MAIKKKRVAKKNTKKKKTKLVKVSRKKSKTKKKFKTKKIASKKQSKISRKKDTLNKNKKQKGKKMSTETVKGGVSASLDTSHLKVPFPFKSKYGNYIGGKFGEPKSGKYFDSVSPINN